MELQVKLMEEMEYCGVDDVKDFKWIYYNQQTLDTYF